MPPTTDVEAADRSAHTREVPDIHATAPPSRLNSSFINGIKRLPVDFTTSTGGNR